MSGSAHGDGDGVSDCFSMQAHLMMMPRLPIPHILILVIVLIAVSSVIAQERPTTQHPRKIVLIAGKKSHGPGVHEYVKSVRLLKAMLDTSPNLKGMVTEYHLNGWPDDPATLDTADTIMTISDGQDGDRFSPVPFMTPDRMAIMQRQMDRGCGFITFHFSTFAPDRYGPRMLDWAGGYFDWQGDGGERNWYSAIKTLDTEVVPAAPDHPINRGVSALKLREEFYYKIRFRDNDPRLTPIWNVPALDDGSQPLAGVVAWAVQRENGGRGFATTTGHFYDNWRVADYRKMILNAIVWTAHGKVPEGGVASSFYTDQQVTEILDGRPIHALILTGHQHPAHDWRATTSVLKSALEQDPRMRVDISVNIEDLATRDLTRYDLLVLNYCNWQRPGLSDQAKRAFTKYLREGGGLVIIHFSNGAFHYSLPGAGESDWPEFRKICRRVWDHQSDSGHDAYGRFTVHISDTDHPITRGMKSFDTTDELYFNQKGDAPITPLTTAHCKATSRDEPMAWAYRYGRGKVFQTVLGHDAVSLRHAGVAQLIRRAAVWTARRAQLDLGPRKVEDKPQDSSGQTSLNTSSSIKIKDPKDISRADILPASSGLDAGLGGHWGVKNDADWTDNRFNAMDLGPAIACSLDTPTGVVPKAVVLRVGDKVRGGVCFDTQSLTLRAAWTGGLIQFSPTRFGLIDRPRIDGEVRFYSAASTTDPVRKHRYTGLHLVGDRVVLAYNPGGIAVLDVPWLETVGTLAVFTRTIEVSSTDHSITRSLVRLPLSGAVRMKTDLKGFKVIARKADDRVVMVVMRGPPGASLDQRGEDIVLGFSPDQRSRRVKVWYWAGKEIDVGRILEHIAQSAGPENLANLIERKHSPTTAPILTIGHRAADTQPYVIDTLTVPYDNPYRALMFLSGLDFFSNGDAAVCTLHGDVWLVSGIDRSLKHLTWRRFATGLYQPLGLKIVDDQVYVLGRDRVTRLQDRNHDGRADFYENFNSDIATSPDAHQFVTCLETDAKGRFYYVDPRGLHRITADGRHHETLATGWRNPNGLSVGPDGTITVAPQEGNWTPASQICEVKPGGYYGYPGPRVSKDRPLGYDPPLCYIPRLVDNSTAGQVWVTSDRWGPLRGQLLNLSFGASTMQLVLREHVDGVAQGGVVPLSGRFLSGAMRGRFNPVDGQLYVVGTMGWVTNAIAGGSFQRVRYTGLNAYLPTALHIHENGVRITFTQALDPQLAEDVESYAVSRWNYRYRAEYGSKEYSVADPDRVGRDPLPVRSATLLEDGRTVFLEIPDLQPVMQMHIKASLRAADGADASCDIYHTIHRLASPWQVPERSHRAPAEREPALPDHLENGLTLNLTHRETGATDARRARLAALYVPGDEPVSPFLPKGAFTAQWQGYVVMPFRDDITFSIRGRGSVRLTIDDRVVLEGTLSGESPLIASAARLRKGPQPLRLVYESPPEGDAWLRLYWQGSDFAAETLPATSLRHDPDSPQLQRGERLRRGRALFARARCLNCHRRDGKAPPTDRNMPELQADAPTLAGIGDRLKPQWLAGWAAGDTMGRNACPRVSPSTTEANPSTSARDIAAFLVSLHEQNPPAFAIPTDEQTRVAGRKLYQNLGCVACHTPPDGDSPGAGDSRTSLNHIASKWRPSALVEYLRQPRRDFSWSRMPDFHLTHDQAASLAAYLMAPSKRPNNRPTLSLEKGDLSRGRQLLQSTGCLNCHRLPIENRFEAVALKQSPNRDWSSIGCVAKDGPTGRAAHLPLTEDEKALIRDFAAAALPSLDRRSTVEFATRQMASLDCGACHERDGMASRWSTVAMVESSTKTDGYGGEEGLSLRLPPDLTFAGDKLRTDWLDQLLAGSLLYRVRPWLPVHMPAFPVRATLLAKGIAFDHGRSLMPPTSTEPPSKTTEPADLGPLLLSDRGGLGCVTCHSVGDQRAHMQLAFGVINLEHAARRLRHEYYMRWLLNPQRIAPSTPMPAYADATGHTALATYLNADARAQFNAIWHYLTATYAGKGP